MPKPRDEEDIDVEQQDPNASVNSVISEPPILVSPPKKGFNRKRTVANWSRNVSKRNRNSGKIYLSAKTKKEQKGRAIKPPCGEKCRLKCSVNFNEEQRLILFEEYWSLGDVIKLRQFIANFIKEIHPKYRTVRVGSTREPRKPNQSFFSRLMGERKKFARHSLKTHWTSTTDPYERR